MKNTSENIERVIKENQQLIDHLENYKENYNQRIKSSDYFSFILNKSTKKTQESFRKELEKEIFKELPTKEQQETYKRFWKNGQESLFNRETMAAYRTESKLGIQNNLSIIERIFRRMMESNPLRFVFRRIYRIQETKLWLYN